MRFEPRFHPVGMALSLHLVMFERIEDFGIVRGRDHPVEHAQDVLLHRIRLVDVLDQLLFQLAHVVQPPHAELTEFVSPKSRPSEKDAVLLLELVDEQVERGAVVKLEPAHLERHPRRVGELGRAA